MLELKKVSTIQRLLNKIWIHAHHEGILRTALVLLAHVMGALKTNWLSKHRWHTYPDSIEGISTAGSVDRNELDFDANVRVHASHYEATPAFEFQHVIRSLPIDIEYYRFIDYGSGKGRTLLLASEFPFIEVIGIEVVATLHETACRNVAAFPRHLMKCHDVKSLCMNATKYQPPSGPLVVFMYNPFDEVIMERVLDQLSSFSESSDQVYLVYRNPKQHGTILSRFSFVNSFFGGSWASYEITRSHDASCQI